MLVEACKFSLLILISFGWHCGDLWCADIKCIGQGGVLFSGLIKIDCLLCFRLWKPGCSSIHLSADSSAFCLVGIMQILPLFEKHRVIHFNKTDARLANNGLPLEIQRLRCRVNFQALKFAPKIEALGKKLIRLLQAKGHFVALHLRYEMDMLAFSGCNHGCSEAEAKELKRMRLVCLNSYIFFVNCVAFLLFSTLLMLAKP